MIDTVWSPGQVTLPDTRHDDTVAAMAAATFTVIEAAGHFLFHERPAAARDAVHAWLESAE